MTLNFTSPKIMSIFFLYVCRWLKDLFQQGLNRPIEQNDIYATLPEHESKKLSDNFTKLWKEETKKSSPSLFRVFRKIYAKKILGIGIFFSTLDTLSR